MTPRNGLRDCYAIREADSFFFLSRCRPSAGTFVPGLPMPCSARFSEASRRSLQAARPAARCVKAPEQARLKPAEQILSCPPTTGSKPISPAGCTANRWRGVSPTVLVAAARVKGDCAIREFFRSSCRLAATGWEAATGRFRKMPGRRLLVAAPPEMGYTSGVTAIGNRSQVAGVTQCRTG